MGGNGWEGSIIMERCHAGLEEFSKMRQNKKGMVGFEADALRRIDGYPLALQRAMER